MSPLFQEITFDNKNFIIMRDDLSHQIFSGNKARKLAYILKSPQDFSHIKTIVSFGGNQSNFMYALSQLAKLKNWQFEYWVKPLPKFLATNPNGNLQLSLENGMKLHTTTKQLNIDTIKSEYINNEELYFFDQGGRDSNTEIGIADCAGEIKNYCSSHNINQYSVVVASGTGTTALYLEKYLPDKVYTVACVGDDVYLKKQFDSIDKNIKYPKIMHNNSKTGFGQLNINNYNTYNKLLEETAIEFDLLYDPTTWMTLLENYDKLQKPIIYIHCGGTSGNITMLNRYKRQLNIPI